MKILLKCLGWLDRWLEPVALISLCSVVVLALTYSAFVRYFVPIPFFTSLSHKTEEIAVFSFVWLLYWGSVYATKERAHFRVHAHFALLPKSWRRWQYLPGDIVWLAFNLFVIWQGTLLVKSAIDNPEFSLSLEIPMKFIYAIIPLAFLLTCVRLVQSYFRKEPEASSERPPGTL